MRRSTSSTIRICLTTDHSAPLTLPGDQRHAARACHTAYPSLDLLILGLLGILVFGYGVRALGNSKAGR